MSKFDVYKYFFEGMILNEDEDNEQTPPAPNQAIAGQQQLSQNNDPNSNPQGKQEPTANQSAQKQVSSPFDQLTGATIKNVMFEPVENGGAVKLYTSLSKIPIVISWTGDRVTFKGPNGIIPLT